MMNNSIVSASQKEKSQESNRIRSKKSVTKNSRFKETSNADSHANIYSKKSSVVKSKSTKLQFLKKTKAKGKSLLKSSMLNTKSSKSPMTNFNRQDTSKTSFANKSMNEQNSSSFHCLYKSIREGIGAESYTIYKREKTSEQIPREIKEEYNLLEMSRHMEESLQRPKPASSKQKLKQTLDPKRKPQKPSVKSNLYSKKHSKISAKSRKREPRNVSSYSRVGSKTKNNISIEHRKKRRNVSNKVSNAQRKNKSVSKPRRKKVKNQVIMNNIDNSQNVYNNYFINVKQGTDMADVGKMGKLFGLITGQEKFSKQSNCRLFEGQIGNY